MAEKKTTKTFDEKAYDKAVKGLIKDYKKRRAHHL